jgi:hypothetical protein
MEGNEVRINIKPLSINEAYKGRKFATTKLTWYKQDLNKLLPDSYKLPEPPYFISFVFGFSSQSSDWDNCIKTTQDAIATKYNFNDKLIRRGLVDIEIVKKGGEFFTFKIEHLTK